MAYAQKNYNEIQGIRGKYRISQIGCYITAFSNFLQRKGRNMSPLQINAFLRDNGLYVDVDDGIRDDVGAWLLSRIDKNAVVIGSGKGTPPNNDCIVKFQFKSGGGLFNTHFSLVHDAAKGLIVDSWDGKVKSWNVYGGPKTWTAFKYNKPRKPVGVKPVPTSTNYDGQKVTVLPGWGISHAAKAAKFEDWDKEKRWDAIARLNGHGNWKSFKLNPGDRIRVRAPKAEPKKETKPAPKPTPKPTTGVEFVTVESGWGISHVAKAAGFDDYDKDSRWSQIAALNGEPHWNKFHANLVKGQKVRVRSAQNIASNPPVSTPVEAPVIPPATPSESEAVEVPVTVVPPKSYKESYKPLDKQFIAAESVVVKDLDGLQMDLQLVKNQKVSAAGVFAKDGVEYVRTKKHEAEGFWYGVPASVLVSVDSTGKYIGPLLNDDDDLDDDLFNLDMASEAKELLHNLSGREKLVAIVGKLQGYILRVVGFVNIFKKLNKKESK